MSEPDTGGPDPTTEDDSAARAKARFREALDRKQGGPQRTGEGRRGAGAVHSSEVTGGGKRTFRRKTG